MLDENWLNAIALDMFPSDSVELTLQRGRKDNLLYSLVLTIRNEVANNHQSGQVYYNSLLNILGAHLVSQYGTRRPIKKFKESGLSAKKLDLTIAFIQENYARKVKLSEIAEVVGLSEFYFERQFKKFVGMTPHQYLTQCRIDCAKQLLRRNDSNITEISAKCGFSSQN